VLMVSRSELLRASRECTCNALCGSSKCDALHCRAATVAYREAGPAALSSGHDVRSSVEAARGVRVVLTLWPSLGTSFAWYCGLYSPCRVPVMRTV